MVMLAQMIEHGESGGDRRASPRRALRLAGDLPAGGGMQVVIHDLSLTGVLLETSAALAPRETFQVELPETGSVAASVVWSSGEFYGCQFARALSPAALSATLLKSPPKAPAAPGTDVVAELRSITEQVEKIADDVQRAVRRLSDREDEGR